jgi:hypothetical protein
VPSAKGENVVSRRNRFRGFLIVLALCVPLSAEADIRDLVRCQNRFAHAGARFANRSIKLTLKCANAISECQIQCEEGVFGPPCEEPPEPPCCDPDDPNSNAAYGACLDEADILCQEQAAKIEAEEAKKQERIIGVCDELTQEELCGAQTVGLNFAALNAGCLALDPNYECTLPALMECVGGPLERQLTDQISALLDPRASEGFATLNLQQKFPGIPIARKVKQQLAAGMADVWAITGEAGDLFNVRVKTLDDDDDGVATLAPGLILLGSDGTTPVGNTAVTEGPCSVPTVCDSACPQLQRRLPFSGTFFAAIVANEVLDCGGGAYQLVVISPTGIPPVLVFDDVDPPAVLP